jgi:hypothetical protein
MQCVIGAHIQIWQPSALSSLLPGDCFLDAFTNDSDGGIILISQAEGSVEIDGHLFGSYRFGDFTRCQLHTCRKGCSRTGLTRVYVERIARYFRGSVVQTTCGNAQETQQNRTTKQTLTHPCVPMLYVVLWLYDLLSTRSARKACDIDDVTEYSAYSACILAYAVSH